MPSEDINMARMLDKTTNIFDTSETITGFWNENASFVSVMILFVVLMLLFGGAYLVIFFIIKKVKK